MKEINEIPSLVQKLYSITKQLSDYFPGRHFTPGEKQIDGIGEILAAYYYGIVLLPHSVEGHNAKTKDGRLVMVKATQNDCVVLTVEPDFLIVLKIYPTGRSKEMYNGPGNSVWDHAGVHPGCEGRLISIVDLKKIMEDQPIEQKLKKRSEPGAGSGGNGETAGDEITVFLGSENTVKFECPKCGRAKLVDVSEYIDSEIAVRVRAKCKCGNSYIAIVERRKSRRKSTDLPGSYMTADGEKGLMTVRDVSRIGLNIRLNSKADVKVDDWMAVEFRLDDRPRSLIKREVFIRSVKDRDIGVAFSSVDQSKEIGFYLY